jgi:hypothetical protein
MTTFNTRVTFDHIRNTASGFTSANPVLGYGVTGLETNTGKIKIGDGATAWSSLPYSGGGGVAWNEVTGKPETFTPSAHSHTISAVTGLQSALDGKQAAGSYAAAIHAHAIGDVTGLQTALDAKATPADVTAAVAAVVDAAPASLDTLNELAAALGDDANFASTVTNALAGKANATHSHAISDVTGLQSALDGKQASGSYAAASHSHAIADVTGLQSALDGKQASGSYLTAVPDGSVTDAKITSGGLSASSINWAAIAEWQPSTSYAKGALVSYLGVGYRRSSAGTTGATFNPANWQQITPSVNVVGSPSQITANQNDYALPSAADIVRVSSDAARTITGIVAGVSGQAHLLINVGSFAITLSHASTSSASGNRFAVPWAGNYVLDAAGGAALIVYDSTSAVWRVV